MNSKARALTDETVSVSGAKIVLPRSPSETLDDCADLMITSDLDLGTLRYPVRI